MMKDCGRLIVCSAAVFYYIHLLCPLMWGKLILPYPYPPLADMVPDNNTIAERTNLHVHSRNLQDQRLLYGPYSGL